MLSDKLKALGVQVGTQNLPAPQPRRDIYAIEKVIPGEIQTTPHGDAYVVRQRYATTYCHGCRALQVETPLDTLAQWVQDERVTHHRLNAFVFLDTETSGMASASGTYAFLIGAGRYRDDHFELRQFFMRDPIEEAAQLAALTDFIQPCDTLVTFNGKSFDVPLLNGRYIHNRAHSPLLDPAHLDLLPLARRLWRERLPSRALGQLEKHILDFHREDDDVPGWLIPTIYFNYLRSGDARPLKGVFYHNAMDVVAMAALLNHMGHMLEHHTTDHGLEMLALARLFDDMGQPSRAATLYQQALDWGLPEPQHWDTLGRFAQLQRRQQNWDAAVWLWEQAAEGYQLVAYEHLAKFYEHQTRNYPTAIRWTEQALTLLATPRFASRQKQWQARLTHRLTRLHAKHTKNTA